MDDDLNWDDNEAMDGLSEPGKRDASMKNVINADSQQVEEDNTESNADPKENQESRPMAETVKQAPEEEEKRDEGIDRVESDSPAEIVDKMETSEPIEIEQAESPKKATEAAQSDEPKPDSTTAFDAQPAADEPKASQETE